MNGWMDRYYRDRRTLYPDVYFNIDKYKVFFCFEGFDIRFKESWNGELTSEGCDCRQFKHFLKSCLSKLNPWI